VDTIPFSVIAAAILHEVRKLLLAGSSELLITNSFGFVNPYRGRCNQKVERALVVSARFVL
jgi:hypothetical protein